MNRFFARLIAYVPLITSGALAALGLLLSILSYLEKQNLNQFHNIVNSVNALAPKTLPEFSQESIDVALALYAIQVPEHSAHPTLSKTLEDRGLTTGPLFRKQRKVFIGEAAFSSWGVLGSTIAHEAEIHAQQWFLGIWLKDTLQKKNLALRQWVGDYIPLLKPSVRELFEKGTWSAEREAYEFEINSAARFGLELHEVKSIAHVMNTYYPAAEDIKKPGDTELDAPLASKSH